MPDRKTIFGLAAATFTGCASMTGDVMAQAPPESPVPGPASGLPEIGPEPWQVWHPTPVTPIAEQLSDFHGLLFVIMFAICALVLLLLAYVVIRFNAKSNPTPSRTSHNTVLEVAWTVLPVVILVVIAIPSFRLLYFLDNVEDADLTVKVVGHQWFWEYQYPDQGGFSISSYQVPDEDIQPDGRRILDVDTPIVLPVDTNIRLQITSEDVIHSWGVPSLGFTRDAIPGRLNEINIRIVREGRIYGQCREICGTGHAVMPIVVDAVSKERFAEWVEKAKEEFAAAEPPSPRQLAETPAATLGAETP
ncbi:cytochrome c oxidase subunit II (plasmid) [Skermanella rosea]|uniref:cytochrome c oxidase subunit II n=1 Tax=Skermanella rosea TaxID=1817965 RepID=UPI001931D17C|nr:cytochrome c oxidase subunit II [Skermanella rosea]UEM07950.1 cytochrome c oxidase subunit II [Skermanella rosea]